MQDKELYSQLLGVKEPWKISDVNIDLAGLKVGIYIEWPKEVQAPCPECGKL